MSKRARCLSGHQSSGCAGPSLLVSASSSASARHSIKSPRSGSTGRGLAARFGSVAVLLAAAGPDQGERLAVLDEIGVDRSGEARIVELDREVVASFVGALRPGGADLGATDIDPMAGSVVARPVGIGDDADALALQAQGDDFALELVAGLLEGADICHVTSPWLFEPATIAASMAICRPKAIDD